MPNHFQSKRNIRDSRKAYQNPTTSAYFIPGISGKARCLVDDCPRESVLADCAKSIGSTNTVTNSTRSIATNSSCGSSSRTSSLRISALPRNHQHHLSAPSSPTMKRTTMGRRNSSSLNNVTSTKSLNNTASRTNQPNESFGLNDSNSLASSKESHSTRSVLLQNQLASIRSILSEGDKTKNCEQHDG